MHLVFKTTLIFFNVFLLQHIAFAQGIKFENNLNWQQLLQRAKLENKYIFLDCFATWCGPCKAMDKTVFNKDSVGSYFNSKFISAKIQMDQTSNDDLITQSWYTTAKKIQEQYNIYAYPSFLVISNDGVLIYRDVGYKTIKEFIEFGKVALDSTKRFDILYDNFKKGNSNPEMLRSLALIAKKMGYKEISDTVAKEYKSKYLDGLKNDELLKRKNIDFIIEYNNLVTSTDVWFQFFYKYSDKTDSIIGKFGFSKRLIDFIITKEEINSQLYQESGITASHVNWKKIYNRIKHKYDKEKASILIINAKIGWYTTKKDWPNAIKYNIKKIEKLGIDTSGIGRFNLNNMIWDVIFKHSNDYTILEKAIHWMEIILPFEPDDYAKRDTYANLLYKIGKVNDAIIQEEKALQSAIRIKAKSTAVNELITVKNKMVKREPTWE